MQKLNNGYEFGVPDMDLSDGMKKINKVFNQTCLDYYKKGTEDGYNVGYFEGFSEAVISQDKDGDIAHKWGDSKINDRGVFITHEQLAQIRKGAFLEGESIGGTRGYYEGYNEAVKDIEGKV